MRSMLLATTAVFALTGFGAIAQTGSGSGDVGRTGTSSDAPDTTTGTPQGDGSGPIVIPGETGAGDADTTGTTDATPGDGAVTTAGAGGQDYESYEEMADGDAAIEGGYTAEELVDASVVNMDGDEIGTIEDLAVGPDGRTRHALVDVSGFFEVESRYLLVDLAQLRRGEGDAADDEFVLDLSEEAIDAMPRYERSEDRWTMESRTE